MMPQAIFTVLLMGELSLLVLGYRPSYEGCSRLVDWFVRDLGWEEVAVLQGMTHLTRLLE